MDGIKFLIVIMFVLSVNCSNKNNKVENVTKKSEVFRNLAHKRDVEVEELLYSDNVGKHLIGKNVFTLRDGQMLQQKLKNIPRNKNTYLDDVAHSGYENNKIRSKHEVTRFRNKIKKLTARQKALLEQVERKPKPDTFFSHYWNYFIIGGSTLAVLSTVIILGFAVARVCCKTTRKTAKNRGKHNTKQLRRKRQLSNRYPPIIHRKNSSSSSICSQEASSRLNKYDSNSVGHEDRYSGDYALSKNKQNDIAHFLANSYYPRQLCTEGPKDFDLDMKEAIRKSQKITRSRSPSKTLSIEGASDICPVNENFPNLESDTKTENQSVNQEIRLSSPFEEEEQRANSATSSRNSWHRKDDDNLGETFEYKSPSPVEINRKPSEKEILSVENEDQRHLIAKDGIGSTTNNNNLVFSAEVEARVGNEANYNQQTLGNEDNTSLYLLKQQGMEGIDNIGQSQFSETAVPKQPLSVFTQIKSNHSDHKFSQSKEQQLKKQDSTRTMKIVPPKVNGKAIAVVLDDSIDDTNTVQSPPTVSGDFMKKLVDARGYARTPPHINKDIEEWFEKGQSPLFELNTPLSSTIQVVKKNFPRPPPTPVMAFHLRQRAKVQEWLPNCYTKKQTSSITSDECLSTFANASSRSPGSAIGNGDNSGQSITIPKTFHGNSKFIKKQECIYSPYQKRYTGKNQRQHSSPPVIPHTFQHNTNVASPLWLDNV